MVIIRPLNKFKTFKYDAAPFFFFIDVFPADYSNRNKPNLINLINTIKTNPIIPLPMRIDRVFNGERSILIRPKEPISFSVKEDLTAIINPAPFLRMGFEKLLYFTEVRSREKFLLSLSSEMALKWWKYTRFLYGNLPSLEEDFSAFLRAYLHTIVRAKILEEDPIKAAKNYCQLIADVCEKRIEQNVILAEVKEKQENLKMYKIKEVTYYKKFKKQHQTQYHPELIDIEIYDLTQKGFLNFEGDRIKNMKEMDTKVIKYIPLLIYDDLLECMLHNLKRLENGDNDILDPSLLFEKNIIITYQSKDFEKINKDKFTWWSSFENIDLDLIVRTILKIEEDFASSFELEVLR